MISSLHIQRITVLVSHWTGAQLVLNLISVGGCHWSKYSTFTLSDAWPAWARLDWRERERETGPAQTLESASVDCPLYLVSMLCLQSSFKLLFHLKSKGSKTSDGSVHVLRQGVSVNTRLLVPVCVRCCLDVPQ